MTAQARLSLPPRLAAVAALVPPGARLVDVGTDHGYLPLLLLEEGRVLSAIATDIAPGPLGRARHVARAMSAELAQTSLFPWLLIRPKLVRRTYTTCTPIV